MRHVLPQIEGYKNAMQMKPGQVVMTDVFGRQRPIPTLSYKC